MKIVKDVCNENHKPLKKKLKTSKDRKSSHAHGLAESIL
jgi:hypothetical protein